MCFQSVSGHAILVMDLFFIAQDSKTSFEFDPQKRRLPREEERFMKRMIIVVTAITAIAAIAITTISVPDRFE